jgi:hypothetical protein
MILATLLGRLQTKLLTYLILGVVTLVFVWLKGPVYLWAFGVTMIVGIILEAVWGLSVVYQPGWLTVVFGAVEFLSVLGITLLFRVPMPMLSALLYYLTAWSIIQLFLLYMLPVWRMSWGEDGAELW